MTSALLITILCGLLLPSAGMAHAARAAQPQTLARIELTDMSPRVVTTASEPVLRLRGQVVNVGDRSISKLEVRLQRDEPVTSDEAAARAIHGVPEAFQVTRFRPVSGDLAPGQRSPFVLDVPLGGGAALESLQITQPGVYPLLVNLNGKPDFGGTARLASVPLLLPVLGVPPAVSGGFPGRVLPTPAQPIPLTVVWPLVAEPARLPTGPSEPILISSDRAQSDPMAVQLAPGGRLDGLLGALEKAVPPGSPLASALCVAIDPLLLETVHGMSRGYQVSHPGGISEGTGVQDAHNWLGRLRSAVQGRCVLPLPYADPDLVALSRAGLTDLEALATTTGVRVVRDLLGVKPLHGVIWPADGVLDERTLADLATLQTRAVLLESQGIAQERFPANRLPDDSLMDAPRGDGAPHDDAPRDGLVADAVVGLAAGVAGSGGSAPVGLIMDSLLTGALDTSAVIEQPGIGQTNSSATMVAARPTGTASPLAAQDGLGVLVYRAAIDPDREPILLVPPRRWQAGGLEAGELLGTARSLLEAGYLAPYELAGLANTPPAGPTAAVTYPPQAELGELPPAVAAEVQRTRDVLRDLQVATVRDATVNLEPANLLDPLRLGLLRGTSSAWSDQPDRAAQTIQEVRGRLGELRRSVHIVPPPGPYTLAASDSPLLITVSNELPVGVQVRLTLSDTAGLRTGVVGVQLVPARSTRQFVIPAEVSRAGQFSVTARLSTPSGTTLGSPSTLQLRSTAFGTVTIALTAGAGAVLIVLTVYRVVRRMRSGQQTGEPGTG